MFYKSKVFLMVILFVLAMILVGCNLITPGADEPSAKVVITSVSGYLWQTKGTGVELSPILGDGLSRSCHYVSLSADPLDGGSVEYITPHTCGSSGGYYNGTLVTIKATAYPDWEFKYWQRGYSGEKHYTESHTFTMSGDVCWKAHFEPIIPKYTLIVLVDPEGYGTATGGGSYEEDKKVYITATPKNSCYAFLNWTGYNVHDSNDPTTYLYMPADNVTVAVNFEKCCEDGQPGDQGPQGDPGPTGGQGATGPQGPAGQDCTLPDVIYVYFTITNTGSIDIQEYTITFSAETNSGVYTGIATGEDLAVEETVYSYVKIDVFHNEVVFIDYSLELK